MNHNVLRIKSEVKKTIDHIIQFCKSNNVPTTLKNFLNYKENNSTIPKSIYFFMSRNYSQYFFFNSKMFYEFYNSLPIDFQRDIADLSEIATVQRLSLQDSELSSFLKELLKTDYIYNKD
jgi:hypothetical protein